ncbi:MAG: peptidase S41 [Treponema sp.]|nr:MAG: peptidase S41 [Treponema sp.]
MSAKKTWIITSVLAVVLLFFSFGAPAIFANGAVDEVPDGNTNKPAADKNMKNLQNVYKFLQEYYVDEIDSNVLYKGAMEGMLNSLDDPYTLYVETDSRLGIDLEDTTKGTFGGIGVTITKPAVSKPEKPAYVEVMSPIDGTPGSKAGLRSGDYITEINSEPTDEMTMDKVLSVLRGKVGTPVTIRVLRGKNLNFELTIVRAKIEIPTVKYTMLPNKIGYIKLIQFNPNSMPRITDAFTELQSKGCKKLVFDLRNNPGGLITSAVDVASLFLDKGIVVSTKSRIASENREFSVNKYVAKIPKKTPVVILINGGSASASEIVAGALKDHKRAYLVGKTTFGKGSVQMIYNLNKEEGFKMTIAKYYTPSDANINKIGIPPDYEVDVPTVGEAEEDYVIELYESKKLEEFSKNNANSNITKADIHNFAKVLQKDYPINLPILEILIKTEVDRYRQNDIVDIDFDVQLKAAVELLMTKNVNKLSKSTKTVAELQKTAEQEKESK